MWSNKPLIKQYEQFKALSPLHTKTEFARRCGVPVSPMVQYLGNRTTVTKPHIEKICKALTCGIQDIVSYDGDSDDNN